MLIIR
ncbi:hypothetical protein YPPY101_0823, partial [Yersinia pestis PY-101]